MAVLTAFAVKVLGSIEESCVGIAQGKRQPTIGHLTDQTSPSLLSVPTSLTFLAVIFQDDALDLSLFGTGFAGRHNRFAACGVVGQFVAGHLALVAALASAPPEGIARLCPTIGQTYHCQLAVDLTNSIPR